jgi:hypothetical protein
MRIIGQIGKPTLRFCKDLILIIDAARPPSVNSLSRIIDRGSTL